MSVSLPNGAIVSIASGYGSSQTMSALTNANPGVATVTGHGLTDGDIIEVTSGWSKLDGRIVRIDNGATNDFELEGINTSNTTNYPAGSGTGSIRDISAWTQLTQILNSSSQGGEPQFANYQFLEDDTQRQIPTNKSAQALQLSLADDQSLPWYAVLEAADEDRLARAIRVVLPSGAILLYNATVSFNKTPSLTINEVMALQCVLSLSAPVTRYAS